LKTDEPSQLSILLIGNRKEYKLEINPEQIDFVVSTNETDSYNFSITNTGSIAYQFDFPYDYEYFTIEANKNLLMPNEVITAKATFKGSSKDTTVTQSHIFIDPCDKTTSQIELRANIGTNTAITKVDSPINISPLKCGISSSDTSIVIENIGQATLQINSVSLSDNENFQLLNTPNQVNSKSSENILLRFSPRDYGNYSCDITIESNADNYENGTIILNITAGYHNNNYSISTDTLIFKNVYENAEVRGKFTITNLSDFDSEYVINETNIFRISHDNITIIKNKTQELEVIFPGGTADNEYIETITISDECGLEKKLTIIAEIVKYPQVIFSTPDFSGSPGDKVDIPIFMTNPFYDDFPETEGYDLIISTNATILYEQTGKLINQKDGRSFYEIKSLPNRPYMDSTSYMLSFICALGNSDSTELRIEEIKPIDHNIFSISYNSVFKLLDVCDNNGLINEQGVIELSQNYPNPANLETEIGFSLLESGFYIIELYNGKGQKLEVIDQGESIPGYHTTKLNTGKYGSGIYYYVLKTKSQTRIRKLQIVH
jgi:hypothetical protein